MGSRPDVFSCELNYDKLIFYFSLFPYWANFPVGAFMVYGFMLFHLGFLSSMYNDNNPIRRELEVHHSLVVNLLSACLIKILLSAKYC